MNILAPIILAAAIYVYIRIIIYEAKTEAKAAKMESIGKHENNRH